MHTMMKLYSGYKNTNLPWLNRVPSHWDLTRMKHLFTERVDKGHPSEPLLSATQSKGVVRQDKYENRTMVATKNFESLKLVKRDDFVISLRSFEGGIEKAHDRGIISSAYTVLKPGKQAHRGFFEYFFKSKPFIDALSLYVTGIRDGQNINYSKLSRSNLPIPPLSEQRRIARFLDTYTDRTDRLIRAKEQLIELLEEQKQAIIQRAVTRGLDPDVEMKDSGVDWLGEVPAHWEVRRLKFAVTIANGQVDPREEPYASLPLIGPNHIEKGTGRFLGAESAREQGAISGKYFVEEGEVIYSKIRPELRKATIAVEDCLCSADMYPLAVDEKELIPEYLVMLLLSKGVTHYLVDASMRVAMPKVNREALRGCWISYPDLDEQRDVLSTVRRRTRPIDESIERAQSEITLIREYRTRLIADVVTGKLDVREAEAAQEAHEVPVDMNTPQTVPAA